MPKKQAEVAHIKLTPAQQEAIAPLRDKLTSAAFDGKPGMLLGQIFGDTMRVGFLVHSKAVKVVEACGGDITKRVSAVEDYDDKVIAKA